MTGVLLRLGNGTTTKNPLSLMLDVYSIFSKRKGKGHGTLRYWFVDPFRNLSSTTLGRTHGNGVSISRPRRRRRLT